MEPTTAAQMQKALAARLARSEIPDAVVTRIAKRIAAAGLKVSRIDFCPYGICIDYFWDKRILVDKLIANERFRAVKLFPYGILVDDLWHVHAEMAVPELNELGFGG
jgi:hypothetical protein